MKDIELPDIGQTPGFSGRYDQTDMFFYLTTFSHPGKIYHIDLSTATLDMKEIFAIKLSDPSINLDDYVTDQVFYPSKDGTRIPMFIVRKKSVLPLLDVRPEVPLPTLLYGYGGYGISILPEFSSAQLLLLNNFNGVFVLANIRAGGEYGEYWHRSGIKEKKQNVFDDFIAAGEYLIESGITDEKHLTINGGSNGGLLVTAVAN